MSAEGYVKFTVGPPGKPILDCAEHGRYIEECVRCARACLEQRYEALCDVIRELPQDLVRETRDVEEAVRAVNAEILRLRAEVAELRKPYDGDKPTKFDAAIAAARDTRIDEPDRYWLALELVGAKHSKYALVDMVNWLLKIVEEKGRIQP